MVVFRAPSTSSVGASQSSVNGDARRSVPKKTKRPRRARSHSERPSNADLAASKLRREHIFEHHVPIGPYMFVYVGNISTKTTHAALKELFSVCGTVQRVIIRQSFFLSKVPKGMGTCYATVHFKEPTATDKALFMRGAVLDGCELAVGRQIYDIPDGPRIIAKRRAQRTAPHRLVKREPTLKHEETQQMPEAGSSFFRENLGTPQSRRERARGKKGNKLSTVVEDD